MASALSVFAELTGTASGLLGFLQMGGAALGTIVVAALPHEDALGLVAVVCGLIVMSFGFGVFGVTLAAARPANPACGRRAADPVAVALPQLRERIRHDRRNP